VGSFVALLPGFDCSFQTSLWAKCEHLKNKNKTSGIRLFHCQNENRISKGGKTKTKMKKKKEKKEGKDEDEEYDKEI
jgi:hypothetical protein